MNLRSEGRPIISMLAQITGCITNILLDALFIIVFKMGVFGAAFATLLGHFANFLVGLSFYWWSFICFSTMFLHLSGCTSSFIWA